MNNKGQSLVLFVILLPILIILFAYLFDLANLEIEKIKLNDISKTAFQYLKEKEVLEVKQYIIKNDEDIDIIYLTKERVRLEKEIKLPFSNLIGLKNITIYKEYKE